MLEATADENEQLRARVAHFDELSRQAAGVIRRQNSTLTTLYSNLQAVNASNSSRSGGGGTSSKHVEPVKERSEGSAADVPGEVLPTDVPDSRGLSEEHADEGRQTEGGDTEGGVRSE